MIQKRNIGFLGQSLSTAYVYILIRFIHIALILKQVFKSVPLYTDMFFIDIFENIYITTTFSNEEKNVSQRDSMPL